MNRLQKLAYLDFHISALNLKFLKMWIKLKAMQELTKKEKKIARDIFSLAIEKEFETASQNSEIIMAKWKSGNAKGREVFHETRSYLNDFLKHLERRYDNLRVASYLMTLAGILKDGYITEEDIKDFSHEAKEMIKRYNDLH
jgi:hypothetical protein